MTHLTEKQRYEIYVKQQNGMNCTQIANAIGVNKSTISRELRRNCDKRDGVYKPDLAQRKYEQRKKTKRRRCSLTDDIKERINELILKDLSPEQIVGRCKHLSIKMVSHETIYKYIWNLKRHKITKLSEHLRRHGRKYSKRGNAYKSRGIIPNKVSIDERDSIVDEKTRVGDLEIDCVIGKNHHKVILTINDRATGFLWAKILPTKDAEPLKNAVIETLMPIKDMIHTITSDNGKEFAKHLMIAKELNIKYFFAHPYHSWERGANENLNGLLRQYFPKGSSFELINDEQLQMAVDKINNRPRKRFEFLSPSEKFYQLTNINYINNAVAFIS